MTGLEIARAVLVHGPSIIYTVADLIEIGDREITLDDIQKLRDRHRSYEQIIADAQDRANG